MSPRTSSLICIGAIILAELPAFAAGNNSDQSTPQASKQSIEETPDKVRPSLITLQADNEPAGEVVAKIAKEMGFLSACARPLKGKRITCSYTDKPAWECMVDIFERFDVTFAGTFVTRSE